MNVSIPFVLIYPEIFQEIAIKSGMYMYLVTEKGFTL